MANSLIHLINDRDRVQLATSTNNSYAKYCGMEGVVEGEPRVRIRYPNGKTIYPFVSEVVKIKEDTMFEVGDRVEVVYANLFKERVGSYGVITRKCSCSQDWYVMFDKDKVDLCFGAEQLKLIKKGNNMKEQEIKVGQVWMVDKDSPKGVTVEITGINTRDKNFEGNWSDNFKGSVPLNYLTHSCKLITDIKGEKKMDKKTPKGKKLKVGDYIFDSHCSNNGTVTELTRDHCVYDDTSDGEEIVRKYEYIYLMVEKPKVVLPKETKKAKKKKK